MHEHFLKIYKKWSTDEQGKRCMQGCEHFYRLAKPSDNWGICTNNVSPRVSSLTPEDCGCPYFDKETK